MTTFSTALSQIEALYVGYFGRAGDPLGTNYWATQVSTGAITVAGLAASYSVQPESATKYPYLASPNTNDPTTFINQVYQNLFNRSADAAGLAYWQQQLIKGGGDPGAIGAFILDVMSGGIGTDNTTLLNKVDIAQDITAKVTAGGMTWNTALRDLSVTVITSVTDSTASVAAGKAAVDAGLAAGGTAGVSLQGTSGSDTLTGGAGNDDLHGLAGNDTLIGGLGSDVLDGGTGTDYASYVSAASGVTASLSNPSLNTGEAAGDTYTSIENLAGSAFADRLIGNGISIQILKGQGGADILDGGTGFDYSAYGDSLIGLTVSLANPSINTGEAAGDLFVSIEGLIGTAFSDALTGDAASNWLQGGAGADILDGGTGIDTASYADATSGVTVSLANPGLSTGIAAGDTFISIESLAGSDFADSLSGDGGNNELIGQGGADVLDGGNGFDYATYFNATSGVVASLASPTSNTGQAAGDTYISIEGLNGSEFADTLIGNVGANGLIGRGGADLFVFNTALGNNNIDSIFDFVAGTDRVGLNQTIFAAVGAVGTLASTAFVIGTAAQTASQRIIYNAANGNLLYDPDGNGAQAFIQFAILPTGLSLTGADFVIL